MNVNRPAIAVLGSINMDLVIRCDHLPVPGETVLAENSREMPGGKGANQAVAAARAGGSVTMIGRVGDDAFSSRLLENLRRDQVNVDAVQVTPQCASGLAVVAVQDDGENSILVVPGANGRVTVADVEASTDRIRAADALVVQLEVPLDAVSHAIDVAQREDVPVILDPAPMPRQLPLGFLRADVICPNQSEASAIVGEPVATITQAQEAVRKMVDLGARRVIITLGSEGTVVADESGCDWIKPFEVTAVDTTAAGDAFAGALAVRLSEGASLRDATAFASAAGAIAATRHGAQAGMANRREIKQRIG